MTSPQFIEKFEKAIEEALTPEVKREICEAGKVYIARFFHGFLLIVLEDIVAFAESTIKAA